jgi:hypothetical protein
VQILTAVLSPDGRTVTCKVRGVNGNPLLRRGPAVVEHAVYFVQLPLQVTEAFKNLFTIPERSCRPSRRREGDHAEDVSAHKHCAF